MSSFEPSRVSGPFSRTGLSPLTVHPFVISADAMDRPLPFIVEVIPYRIYVSSSPYDGCHTVLGKERRFSLRKGMGI